MRRHLRTFCLSLLTGTLVLSLFGLQLPTSYAAANMAVAGSGNFSLGQTITVNISINTGGVSANAFQGTFSYPSSLFEGIRGSFSGSICTLPILVPDPSGGTAAFSCGRPSGFNGNGIVATIVLKAIGVGSGSFGLSGCDVLANDGQGTSITGGCTGLVIAVADAPTPGPTPTPGATPVPTATVVATFTPTPNTTRTPKPSTSPKGSPTPLPTLTPRVASPTPSQVVTTAETAAPQTPTPEPSAPAVQALASAEPTPTPGSSANPVQEQRTIGQALQDIFSSTKDLSNFKSSPAGVIAVMVTTIPFLALIFGIVILLYRLYMMDRRRRRTLDRLFEMELAELASLEGKLDLLSEKGTKGKDQFKDEFKRAKENILRQIKPDFAKPIDKAAKAAAKTAEAAPEKTEAK